LSESKGVWQAATAIAGCDDLALVVLGDGELAGPIEALAATNSNIVYLGAVDDALPYIAAADFGILLTSDHGEGRPLFGIECVAVNVPLIGLEGSAAVTALRTQFGDRAIIMTSGRTIAEIRSAVRQLRPIDIKVNDWSDTANVANRIVRRAIAAELDET
jgi:hypothetical protein